jgi:RNA recognition motif-containing protein
VKRWNVVSNNPEFENTDDLVPVIYTSIRNDPPYNTESHLREVFSKFGFIRNIEVKVPTMKSYKAYALIEFETLPQALRARERVRPNR